MSTERDVTRIVRSWIREDEHESADRVLGIVLDQLDTTPQRRSTRWPARRAPSMNKIVSIGLAAGALLVAVFIGVHLFGSPSGGTGGPGGEPTAAPVPTATIGQGPSHASSPSAAQTDIAEFPGFGGAPKPVDAGTYDMGPDFPVSISFVVPDGWLSCVNNAGLLCLDSEAQVNFFIITNVVADPCDGTALRDPAVGPTVDDLVTAIASLPWSAVTPPTDVTVDGFRGREFEVTVPPALPCTGTDHTGWWETVETLNSGSALGEAPGTRIRLRILDVQGSRIVIASSYLPGTTSSQDLAEINAIIDSVRIEPRGR